MNKEDEVEASKTEDSAKKKKLNVEDNENTESTEIEKESGKENSKGEVLDKEVTAEVSSEVSEAEAGTSLQEDTAGTTEEVGTAEDDSSDESTTLEQEAETTEWADMAEDSSDDSTVGTRKRKGRRGRRKGTKAPNKKQATTIYQFKITLLYTNPIIWRRLQVPKHRFTFAKLHTAITEAMGWSGCFQYCFRIYDPKTDRLVIISRPNPLWQENPGRLVDETNTKITTYFPSRTTVAQYEYDYGDAWLHEVLFEGEVVRRTGEVYPQCIDGERACPPEECGGIGAFEHICEVLKDPEHPEYEETKSWLQYMSIPDYDPDKFDLRAIKLSKSGDCVWVNK